MPGRLARLCLRNKEGKPYLKYFRDKDLIYYRLAIKKGKLSRKEELVSI